MKRTFTFISGGEELSLPVTPAAIETASGIRIETVNINGLGDLRIAGNRTLANITISSFFPAHQYRFANARYSPQEYVRKFQAMARAKSPVRFIVHGTGINLSVFVEGIRFGEKDGTNDIYYSISLSECEAAMIGGGTPPRPISSGHGGTTTYTVKRGDTMWSIARRFLGNGSRYPEIERANNLKEGYVLLPGQVLIIPSR